MTDGLWPWLAVAAAGALHGLNPAAGWALAACAARVDGKASVAGALMPLAAGHLASVLTVAAAVPVALQLGLAFDPLVPQWLAGGLLLVAVVRPLRGAGHRNAWTPGLALWSFIAGTASGAGWMLVPALVPLCGGDMPARDITASGSLWRALLAVAVHMGAMLAATAVLATAARLGWRAVWKGVGARLAREQLHPGEPAQHAP